MFQKTKRARSGMPSSATVVRQERLKKSSTRPNPPGLFTINEEDEQQKNGNSRRSKGLTRNGKKSICWYCGEDLLLLSLMCLHCNERSVSQVLMTGRNRDGRLDSMPAASEDSPASAEDKKVPSPSHAASSHISISGSENASEDSPAPAEDKKGPSPSHATSSHISISGSKKELTLMKADEKQKLAKERRDELEKQFAAREAVWLERKERARQHYERHLEERKKRLEEQRLREERRRAAVEEKRKQKFEEDKERHEAVLRRTAEKGQKPRQKQNRWSWGGTLHSNMSRSSTGLFVASSVTCLDFASLEHHFRDVGGACKDDADRRSVSTMNLTKYVDPIINKRLSSSSATLLNSPDRAVMRSISFSVRPCSKARCSLSRGTCTMDPKTARRLQLTPWESNIVTRLLTPTHSFLARSRSTATLSGDSVIPICPRSASCSPITPPSHKTVRCRSVERPKVVVTATDVGHRKSTYSQSIDKKEKDRENERERHALLSPSTITVATLKRSLSPSQMKPRSLMPSPVRAPPRTPPPTVSSTPRQSISSPTGIKVSPVQIRPPSPGNVRPIKKEMKQDSEKKDQEKQVQLECEESTEDKGLLPLPPVETSETTNAQRTPVKPEPVKETVPTSYPTVISPTQSKSSPGNRDAEEAARLLAEKRRLAREQREREEQEKKEKEEAERRAREEMTKRKAEEKARREEEARLQEEERKQKEEEQRQIEEELQRKLDEEKAQKEKEKEEEEARIREEAERLRLEREKHFQKEEQERLERKKRLEEIMKRTRRSDTSDKKSAAQRNGEISTPTKTEETEREDSSSVPEQQYPTEREAFSSPDGELALQQTRSNGEITLHRTTENPETYESTANTEQPKENGVSMQMDSFEEIITLPVETKASKLDVVHMDENSSNEIPVNPVIAFEDHSSLGSVSQVDIVQPQQTTEVI
ncbi:ensconsin [Protopterus annectens]|uniref:ensconsin n=1 Tax=Protopterus annectens TaxID=7888 RepID=UPI001CFBE2CD|nr:ensconsin [Protopterus annectens]